MLSLKKNIFLLRAIIIKDETMDINMKNIKNTILIVDDDHKIRRMLKDYLQSKGYTIMEAVDGVDALARYYTNNNTIDLILLDVMMNKMNGFDVLEELRENSDIPVIMLTARGEEYDELYGLNKGADDYISKPFSLKLLNARIEAVKIGRASCRERV